MTPYRLGIDVGTNSIGWCVLDLNGAGEPTGIRATGVRIFPDGRDPQSGTSLAVDRRTARSARRRRDRFLLRQKDMISALVGFGLMPDQAAERKALETLDPYELRARGLDSKLTLHEFGRALFHLNQRRGFRSNRKTDRGAEKEKGKIKQAAGKLEAAMAESGSRTVGEFLAKRRRDGQWVRARLRGDGAKAEYDFYPQRAMLEAEFDALWSAQQAHHSELTEEARESLRKILFRQRDLRPVLPGKCALDPARDPSDLGGMRAPWALPLAQRFRIVQELANLRIVRSDYSQVRLDAKQRDLLLGELLKKKKVSFDAMRRALGLSSEHRFNLESEKRQDLQGDETAAVLADKKRFGKRWHELDPDQQTAIVERLLSEPDEAVLISWLQGEWGLDAEAAEAVADAPVPDGYCRLGRRALSRIVPIMEDQGLGYADAAREAGYDHSDRRPEDLLDELPYYGEALADHVVGTGDPDDPPEARFGRIANPTVHVGLNQLRKLVNALIETHGRPHQIVIELARELKQSQKEKERIQKEQAENQKKNDARRAQLAECGQADNGENRMRLRLWEELDPVDALGRRCVYTGEVIGMRRLFSDEVEIDHILPFSKTLDNSAANRIVSLRRANREKGNRTPYEAWGHDAKRWQEILERAKSLKKNKRWRFAADAMESFQANRDFLDRQLTDTAYLGRVAKAYLTNVCPDNRVYVVTGQLTALLRAKWGLNAFLSDANQKNRTDHRHHAIDAIVAAVTDRSMLQRIATAAGRTEREDRERLVADMPEPWDGFREEVGEAVRRIIVSHRPDHGTAGRLHEKTAYGILADPAREEGYTLVAREPLASLTENKIERIRDLGLRKRVQDHVRSATATGQKLTDRQLKEVLAGFVADTGVRRVRLLKKEADFVAIEDGTGRPYKAYIPGDNHHIDIYRLPDGSWAGEAVTVFQASQPNYIPEWKQKYPAAPLIMRVHKGDLLKLEDGGDERVMRVVKLQASQMRIWLVAHNEGGNFQERHDTDNEIDPFRWQWPTLANLKGRQARLVSVDVLGRVHDGGFKG